VVGGVDPDLLQRLNDLRMRRRAGSLPAERAWWRSPASRRNSRSAIIERPLFATQTKSTFT
jgi:hypothetical protein